MSPTTATPGPLVVGPHPGGWALRPAGDSVAPSLSRPFSSSSRATLCSQFVVSATTIYCRQVTRTWHLPKVCSESRLVDRQLVCSTSDLQCRVPVQTTGAVTVRRRFDSSHSRPRSDDDRWTNIARLRAVETLTCSELFVCSACIPVMNALRPSRRLAQGPL